jgi:hypothetical protein
MIGLTCCEPSRKAWVPGRPAPQEVSRPARSMFQGSVRQWLPLLVALAALLPVQAEAGFFNTFGPDARGTALGGAMAALSEGWASVYHNPACLALTGDVEVTVGAHWAKPTITLEYQDGPETDLPQFPPNPNGLDTIAGPTLGLLVPIQRLTPKKLPVPIAIGAGLFVPRQALATTRVIEEPYPFDPIFSDGNGNLVFQCAVSSRITPALYFGAGLASQLVTPVNVVFAQSPGNSVDLKARFGAPSAVAGLLLRPTERIRIGLVYRQENKVRSRWDVYTQKLFAIEFPGLVLPEFGISIFWKRAYVSSFTPENYTVGCSYKASERLTVAADVCYYRWSQYGGPADTGLTFEFHDIWIPRVGVLYRISRSLEARGGLSYEPIPVRSQPSGFFPIGNDRIVPSAGIGYTFPAPWGILAKPISVDAFFQYHWLLEQEFVRDVNRYVGNQTLKSSGNVFHLGVDLTFRF